MRAILLAPDLAQYLRSAEFLDEDLRTVIERQLGEAIGPDPATLSVDSAIAERFRAAFTERLAQAGFGVDYRLSAEGSILEDLIDRFAG